MLAAACLIYGVFLILGLGAALITAAFVALVGDWWLTEETDSR